MKTSSVSTPSTITGIGASSSASQKLPVYCETARPKKAPSIKNEPCARLTTFISPKISDRPAAIRNSRTPYTSPFNSWATSSSMSAYSDAPAGSVDLLARVLNVLGGVKNLGGELAAALHHLGDVDVLDRIVRHRIEPELAARRIERDLD